MTALLGPIPPDLVKGRRSSIFYDADGNYKVLYLGCALTSPRSQGAADNSDEFLFRGLDYLHGGRREGRVHKICKKDDCMASRR